MSAVVGVRLIELAITESSRPKRGLFAWDDDRRWERLLPDDVIAARRERRRARRRDERPWRLLGTERREGFERTYDGTLRVEASPDEVLAALGDIDGRIRARTGVVVTDGDDRLVHRYRVGASPVEFAVAERSREGRIVRVRSRRAVVDDPSVAYGVGGAIAVEAMGPFAVFGGQLHELVLFGVGRGRGDSSVVEFRIVFDGWAEPGRSPIDEVLVARAQAAVRSDATSLAAVVTRRRRRAEAVDASAAPGPSEHDTDAAEPVAAGPVGADRWPTPRVLAALRVLAVEPNASFDDARAAYRELSKLYHPDHQAGAPDAMAEIARSNMVALNSAYTVVKGHFGR